MSLTTQLLRSVYFIDTDTGYAVGGSGVILKTINGGSSWIAQTSGTFSTLFSVTFITPQIGVCVGGNGQILRTENGGSTWFSQTNPATNNLLFVNFSGGNAGYAVGFDGVVLKTSLTTGWNPIASAGFNIYPNPANDRVTLAFPPHSHSKTGVTIYNMLGVRVASARPDEAGSFSIAQLPEGFYTVELVTASGKYVYHLVIQRP